MLMLTEGALGKVVLPHSYRIAAFVRPVVAEV